MIRTLRVITTSEPESEEDEIRARFCYQCMSLAELYLPIRTGHCREDLLAVLAADARAYFGDGTPLEHGPLEAWTEEDSPGLVIGRQEFYTRPSDHWRDRHQGKPDAS